jgi:hypothetical protein
MGEEKEATEAEGPKKSRAPEDWGPRREKKGNRSIHGCVHRLVFLCPIGFLSFIHVMFRYLQLTIYGSLDNLRGPVR